MSMPGALPAADDTPAHAMDYSNLAASAPAPTATAAAASSSTSLPEHDAHAQRDGLPSLRQQMSTVSAGSSSTSAVGKDSTEHSF